MPSHGYLDSHKCIDDMHNSCQTMKQTLFLKEDQSNFQPKMPYLCVQEYIMPWFSIPHVDFHIFMWTPSRVYKSSNLLSFSHKDFQLVIRDFANLFTNSTFKSPTFLIPPTTINCYATITLLTIMTPHYHKYEITFQTQSPPHHQIGGGGRHVH